MGRNVVLSPVFDIDFFEGEALNFSDVQAILITSANGVRALCRRSHRFEVPVYCVGDSSAYAARQAGFETVVSANGDVSELANLVVSALRPEGGALLHPAASKLAGDLGGILAGKGFDYRREILYEAKAKECLKIDVLNQLNLNKINELSFFSPRSSKIFVRLLKHQKIEGKLEGCRAFCLSVAVAKHLDEIEGLEIIISDQPTRQSINALIASFK